MSGQGRGYSEVEVDRIIARERIRELHQRGELVDSDACRVLVGGAWLVVAVPYTAMRERFHQAGVDFRPGHNGIYLGADPGDPVWLIADRGWLHETFACASFSAGWAVAEVDATDRDRLGLLPF
jgi:hypothetical protein